MKVFDKTLTLLEHSLDVRLKRQNVLAGNLANVDTPGFRPQDLDFKRALSSAADPTLPSGPESGAAVVGHIDVNGPALAPISGGTLSSPSAPLATPSGIDGNGVDLDRTLTAMAQNALHYGAAARAAGKKLSILRFVASDGAG